MTTHPLQTWLTQARQKLAHSPLTLEDLDTLSGLLASPAPMSCQPKTRQRLLYAHTALPVPTSHVHAMYFIEPVPNGGAFDLTPNYQFPYNSVHDAVIDGWQIVSFPDYKAVVQDREIDIPGYQFILQKLEVYHD
jgi:hypothetical protein